MHVGGPAEGEREGMGHQKSCTMTERKEVLPPLHDAWTREFCLETCGSNGLNKTRRDSNPMMTLADQDESLGAPRLVLVSLKASTAEGSFLACFRSVHVHVLYLTEDTVQTSLASVCFECARSG